MIFCFTSLKNDMRILMGIALNLYVALNEMDILTMSILQIMNTEYLSISLCLFHSLLIMLCSFQYIGPLHPLLRFHKFDYLFIFERIDYFKRGCIWI